VVGGVALFVAAALGTGGSRGVPAAGSVGFLPGTGILFAEYQMYELLALEGGEPLTVQMPLRDGMPGPTDSIGFAYGSDSAKV